MTNATVTERYEGVVTSTEDDQQRGRIKCTCPGLTGDESTELPFFVEPTHDWGWFTIPDVDETIEIEIVASSPQDEIFGQSSLEGLNPRWRAKRFINDNAPVHPDFTSENYGKRRGFATPQGHIFIIDDEAGTFRLSWMKIPDAVDAERSSLLFDEDGKVHLSHKETNSVVLEANKKTVTLDGGNSLTLENNEASATAKIGDGAVSVAIADHLQTLWTQAKTQADLFDAHVHPSAMGPTGPPAPLQVFPAYDTAINSGKVTIPDG
jgi:hypothetical protein